MKNTFRPGVGKRGLSTFNEKIEIAKNSLKVPLCDFYFIKTEHCFVNHATLAGLTDLHFGTFYKCDYLAKKYIYCYKLKT